MVQAIRDYCVPGSDNVCKRFGQDYCCAKINMRNGQELQEYYSCASAEGISNSGGVFASGQFSGTWQCSSAKILAMSLVTIGV